MGCSWMSCEFTNDGGVVTILATECGAGVEPRWRSARDVTPPAQGTGRPPGVGSLAMKEDAPAEPRHRAPWQPEIGRGSPGGPLLTRRTVLRTAAASGVAMFLAACGVAETPTPSRSASGSAAASAAPPVPSSSARSAPPSATAVASSSAPASTSSRSPSIGLGHKIAGLMVVGFRGSRLDDAPWVRTALGESGLGGVILFDRDQLTGADRNILSPDQVRRLTADLRGAAGDRTIIVSVDEEGGIVTRLGPKHGFPAVASEATIGHGTDAG